MPNSIHEHVQVFFLEPLTLQANIIFRRQNMDPLELVFIFIIFASKNREYGLKKYGMISTGKSFFEKKWGKNGLRRGLGNVDFGPSEKSFKLLQQLKAA